MRSFRKIKLNMRPDLLDKLILAYLSDNAPSRTSVCENTGVCKASASKVANALIESGFMCERLFSLTRNERPRLHLFLRDTVRILLIDLSNPRFKMSIISNEASPIFESVYNYDSSINFDDNLNIFLSRCGLAVKHSEHRFCAISVLYADQEQANAIRGTAFQARIPSIRQKDVVSRAVYEIFRKMPDTHLTVSDALCESIRFNVKGSTILNGSSYLFVGSKLLAFHLYKDGSKAVCSPEKLLTADEKNVLSQPHLMTKEDIDDLFVKLCGFMDAAFSPSNVVLESDIHIPDDITAQRITRNFTLTGRSTPLISAKTYDLDISSISKGILYNTVCSLIKCYITVT